MCIRDRAAAKERSSRPHYDDTELMAEELVAILAVSYTHLDVYKRQA